MVSVSDCEEYIVLSERRNGAWKIFVIDYFN